MDKLNDIALKKPFYEAIGKLYYAIASCDNLVHTNEINMVHSLIKEEWDQISELNSNDANSLDHHIMGTFAKLINEKANSSEFYYNAFIQYKSEHESQFTGPIKEFILKSSNAIAESYAKKNKSELILLAKLHLNFNKRSS